jgi:hypothetical protein
VVGLNPPTVEGTFWDPITNESRDLKKHCGWKWDLSNTTHQQMASLILALKDANLDIDKMDERDRYIPEVLLEFDGGKWTASGGQGRTYEFTLTLGTSEVAAVWDFTIIFN